MRLQRLALHRTVKDATLVITSQNPCKGNEYFAIPHVA